MSGRSERLFLTIAISGLAFLSSGGAFAKTFIIPQIVETKGPVPVGQLVNTPLLPSSTDTSGSDKKAEFNYDSYFVFINASGLADVNGPGTGQSEVKIFLFDDATGKELRGANGKPICPAGCRLVLRAGQKITASIERLADMNAGGIRPGEVTLGYAVISTTGEAANATSPFFFIQNNHSSAFQTSVLSYQPEEVAAPSP